jgi:predicted TPR repeat methyltransferase
VRPRIGADALGTMPRQSRRAFWSFYALLYDAVWDSPLTSQVVAAAIGASQGPSVADLGCGTGLASRALVQRGATVDGVDGVTAMVRRATRTHRISRGHVADAA